MKVELLYPDIASLFGDIGNYNYLKKIFIREDDEVFITEYGDRPKFIDQDIDFVYVGSMSEETLKNVIDLLKPYKSEIENYIESERILVATGNSLEIFGKSVDDKKALEIFDYSTEMEFFKRENDLFLGQYNGLDIVGFISRFTNIETDEGFIGVIRPEKYKFEGIKHKNFYGTYLQGPLFIANPHLLKEIIQRDELPLYDEFMKAHEIRVQEHREMKNHA